MATDFDDPGAVEKPGSFDFGGLINTVIGKAADVGKSYLGNRNPAPQQVTQPTPKVEQPKWLMPVLIGGGVLVVLMFAGLIFSGRK